MKRSKNKRNKSTADKRSSHQSTKKTATSNSKSKGVKSKSKTTPKWFIVILILIPILFFVLLEAGLQVFNYGYNTSQWIDMGNGKYILNPDIAKRYFSNTKNPPRASEDIFAINKLPNTYRVFILGGSSGAGYPYMPLGAFSRYIRRRLELVYPNTKIEVVNLSMTAVNSYTVLDLLPGVLDQDPNLILIYAGHNEYYGALGVGSMESFGSSRFVIKAALFLNKFKTTQLVRNFVNSIFSIFSSKSIEKPSGTLMSRLAKDKYIKLNSDTFNQGVEQFSENLTDILSEAKSNNVPVIVGKLVSNLKDQKPFISVATPNFNTANQTYSQALKELNNKNIKKADSLFKLARDLDALRFRAPGKFNLILDSLAGEFGVPTVSLDSIFNAESPDGIVGDNLIVDHLHPNVEGYKLMGRSFYEEMKNSGNLPKTEKPKISFNKQDSVTRDNLVFTDLDSTMGQDIVSLLKNDWPFNMGGRKLPNKNLLNPKNFIDSISLKYIEKKISWVDAHLNAATEYLRKDDIKNYMKYMNVLVYEYPDLKDIPTAVKYFYNHNRINPADYTTKRLGLIALYSKEYDKAINYLSESYKTNTNDTQILYNLALAYTKKHNNKLALNYLLKCLKINPEFPDIENIKDLLLQKTTN